MSTITLENGLVVEEVPMWKGKLWYGQNHSYWWIAKIGATPRPLSGITSVLNVIAKPALIPWAVKMAIEFIKKNCQTSTNLTGDKYYQVLEIELEGARKAHTVRMDTASGLGTDAHALVEEYVKKCIESYSGTPMPSTSTEPRVVEFANWAMAQKLTFIASEVPLADPKLSIAGTPDFIATQGDSLVIGDLKTGSGIYDRVYFAQMAAYGYMWNRWKKQKGTPRLVIVHMPAQKPNQPLAEYWSDDFKGDWEAFKAALTLHRWKDNFAKPKWIP